MDALPVEILEVIISYMALSSRLVCKLWCELFSRTRQGMLVKTLTGLTASEVRGIHRANTAREKYHICRIIDSAIAHINLDCLVRFYIGVHSISRGPTSYDTIIDVRADSGKISVSDIDCTMGFVTADRVYPPGPLPEWLSPSHAACIEIARECDAYLHK